MLGASAQALVEPLISSLLCFPSLASSVLSVCRPFGTLIIWEKVRDSRSNGTPRRGKISNPLRMSRYSARMAYLTPPRPSLVPLECYR